MEKYKPMITQNCEKIKSALHYVNSDDRGTWVKIGMAIKSALGDDGVCVFDAWSRKSDSYNEKDMRGVWKSFTTGGINIATLFFEAKQNGWKEDSKSITSIKKNKPVQTDQTTVTRIMATKAWALSTLAPCNHPYLVRKNIKPHGIGVLGCHYPDAPYVVRSDGNLLIIPMMDFYSNVWSIQFISESGIKAYLRGKRMKGSFYWIEGNTNLIYLCEGFATGATLNEQTGKAVACAFDAHSLIHVAKELIKHFDKDQIVIMADDDWTTSDNPGIKAATKAANEIGAQIRIPDFSGLLRSKKDSDFNDWQRLRNACNGR